MVYGSPVSKYSGIAGNVDDRTAIAAVVLNTRMMFTTNRATRHGNVRIRPKQNTVITDKFAVRNDNVSRIRRVNDRRIFGCGICGYRATIDRDSAVTAFVAKNCIVLGVDVTAV